MTASRTRRPNRRASITQNLEVAELTGTGVSRIFQLWLSDRSVSK